MNFCAELRLKLHIHGPRGSGKVDLELNFRVKNAKKAELV